MTRASRWVALVGLGLVHALVLAGCGGEEFDVGLCPSPDLLARDGAILDRVQVLRLGFQEVEGDEVVAEEVVQGSVDGFSAEGVSETGADLSIWVEGLESADATRPIIAGATDGTVRIRGLRPVCICVTEPSAWEAECQGTLCTFDRGQCTF